ncbi:MAG: ATP-binding protein [Prevotella sp.]|nr:ATP-binding protein [Prevotella sp.]
MRQLKITQKDENINKDVDKKAPKTISEHMECIIEYAENSKLSNEFYQKSKPNIRFVSKMMKLTLNQAVLFSLFMEKSDGKIIYISELSGFLGCRNIKVISMMNDIDELEKRRLVRRCCRDESTINYRVPHEVINAVKQNIEYKATETKDLSTEELFNQMESLFNEQENGEISSKLLLEELNSLIEDNQRLAFCHQIKEYKVVCDDDTYLLLLLFCHRFVNLGDDCVGFHDFEDLYNKKWQFRSIKYQLQQGGSILLESNILEYAYNYGFEDKEYFKITTKAKERLFPELNIKIKQAENKEGLVLHDKIIQKELFYNEREKIQIAQLTSLLVPEKFTLVQNKLEGNGMRKGFACLFYGAPGTGKTETVYQIARATGRDIMLVNISEIKSKWYGESEKQIKEVFDKYRTFVKTCGIAPILLFNEADAVIGKRFERTERSVDQTSNTIQNIILQEMENLDGIMIATTNLTQNLDKAFDRRFLYKIEFDKPSIEAKEKIWHVMMPALSERERLELASNYNFSGGQIENIVRKYTVDSILNGITPTIEAVHNYCRSEFLYKDEERRRVGFMK